MPLQHSPMPDQRSPRSHLFMESLLTHHHMPHQNILRYQKHQKHPQMLLEGKVSLVAFRVTYPLFIDSDSSSDDPIEERKVFIALNKNN